MTAEYTMQGSEWAPLAFLLGTWIGEGGGDPGQGTGGFSFLPDLQGKILVRKNHADYPPSAEQPAFAHDDLMIVYNDALSGALRAIYFDVEDHVIHYRVVVPDAPDTVQFLSDPTAAGPGFRLTYTRIDADTVTLTFEIAPPGLPPAFASYIEARARRAPAE